MLAAGISILVNIIIVSAFVNMGVFYKRFLYPLALQNILFVLIPGTIIIVVSEKSYIVDAIDVVSPYLTLIFVSFTHGLVTAIIVRVNKRLV